MIWVATDVDTKQEEEFLGKAASGADRFTRVPDAPPAAKKSSAYPPDHPLHDHTDCCK